VSHRNTVLSEEKRLEKFFFQKRGEGGKRKGDAGDAVLEGLVSLTWVSGSRQLATQ